VRAGMPDAAGVLAAAERGEPCGRQGALRLAQVPALDVARNDEGEWVAPVVPRLPPALPMMVQSGLGSGRLAVKRMTTVPPHECDNAPVEVARKGLNIGVLDIFERA
jgi:hypothetical protein